MMDKIIKLLRTKDRDNARIAYELLMAKYSTLNEINLMLSPHSIQMRLIRNEIHIGYNSNYITIRMTGAPIYYAPDWISFKLID